MLYGFIGGKGSGKTTSMVELLFKKYKEGKDIYCNIQLDFPKLKGCGRIFDFKFKDFLNKFKNKNFKMSDCVVVVDEIHVYIDSRRSMTSKNILWNKFVTQSRHRTVDIFYTTQDINIISFMRGGQVDIRTRKLTDRIIYCETITKFKNGRILKNYENYIDINTDKMYCYNIVYNTAGQRIGKRIFLGNPIFRFFDSDEIVDTFGDD